MSITQSKRILLLGAYGRKNIGDDIFLKVILNHLKDNEVVFNCWEERNLPKDIDASGYKIVSSKLINTLSIIRALIACDVVIYGGGELWMRLEGSFAPNLSLYRMLVVNALARCFRKRIVYISVGSEALVGWSRFVARLSARLAHDIYLRDARSAQLLGLERYTVVPDIAYCYSLPAGITPRPRQYPQDVPLKIAISPTHLSISDNQVNQNNLKQLSTTLMSAFPDAAFTIIAAMSDKKAFESDIGIAKFLQSKMGSKAQIHTYSSIDETAELLSSQDLVVSYRLHISILSHLVGTPAVGVGYKLKIKKFYEAYSTPKSFCEAHAISSDLQPAIRYCLKNHKQQIELTSQKCSDAHKAYQAFFEQVRGK